MFTMHVLLASQQCFSAQGVRRLHMLPLLKVCVLRTSRCLAGSSGTAAVNAGSSGNTTHSYHFSHMLQMQLPQPWDSVNMTQIIK
jgi:hypothetical protein